MDDIFDDACAGLSTMMQTDVAMIVSAMLGIVLVVLAYYVVTGMLGKFDPFGDQGEKEDEI